MNSGLLHLGATMFSVRWAHRILVLLCLLLVLGVLLYAAWEGWLGGEARERARSIIDPVFALLPNYEVLDRLARVLGATGTALTAAFGVYKGIYYADRNLPERLKQVLARTDERLRKDRQPLLAAINDRSPGPSTHRSVFYVGPLNVALSSLRYPNFENADKELAEALRCLKDRSEAAERHTKNLVEQMLAAHILRGAIASARAEYKVSSGDTADGDREAAEEHFTKAILLGSADLDALELRGRQRDLRKNYGGALEDFEALAVAALQSGVNLRAARGYRLQGELKERTATTKTAIIGARKPLGEGIALLNAKGSLSQPELLEKGRLHLAYARVQHLLQKTNAVTHVQYAISCFQGLRTTEARDLLLEAEKMLREMNGTTVEASAAPTESRSWWQKLFG